MTEIFLTCNGNDFTSIEIQSEFTRNGNDFTTIEIQSELNDEPIRNISLDLDDFFA